MTPDYEEIRRRVDAVLAKQVFFVAGAFKSGTTWVQLLLDAHPEIACRGEGHFAQYLASDLGNALTEYNRRIDTKNRTVFAEVPGFPLFGREHGMFLLATAIGLQFSRFADDPAIRAVDEKTPDNIRALPLFTELFPSVRILHVIRDGRDVVTSGWFHNTRVSPDWLKEHYPTFPDYAGKVGEFWAKDVQAGRDFGRDHPEAYLEVRYEDLIADPARETARLLAFLDVDANDAAVSGCIEAAAFERVSGGRGSGEENRASHFRKGAIGDWRNHFGADAEAAFAKEAGAMLRELGYA